MLIFMGVYDIGCDIGILSGWLESGDFVGVWWDFDLGGLKIKFV